MSENVSENMLQFTDEQQLFLQYASEGRDVLVDACIGSGKTTAIQAACGALAKLGKKVLYLTYNRRLLEEARARIDPRDADVNTFHSFGGRMLNQAGVPANSERDVPSVFVSRLKRIYKFDTVIVDEYQDLSEDLKDMLWHIVKMSLNNYGFAPQFLIVGDKDQKIVDSTEIDAQAEVKTLMQFLSHVHGRPYDALEFTRCFRLDPAYARDIGQAWGKSIIGMNPKCELKKMDITKCALFLSQFEPKDILVLGNNMSWGARVELQNMLEARWPDKFNRDTVYSTITDRDADRRGMNTAECAVFTTFDSAKGMERKVCVVCNFDPGYLNARMKHQTSRDVLKNLFLVAASRGKEYNILLTERGNPVLDFRSIARISGTPDVDMRPEFVSDMFDFKLREDVDRCMKHVSVNCIQEAGNQISSVPSVGQIDLSICAGYHAQAVFFQGYDIDNAISRAWHERVAKGNFPKLTTPKRDWELWRKILYLAALETGQERYFKQVDKPYISDEMSQKLRDRLAERLSPDDCVEQTTVAMFKQTIDQRTGRPCGDKMIRGRMDVVRNGMPWELKFVNELKAEHILQTAMYAVCANCESAALWNLRTDELLEISVPDPRAFLKSVLACVSKHRLTASRAVVRANLDTTRMSPVAYDIS